MERERLVLWICSLTALLAVPNLARAQTCAADTECDSAMFCYSRVVQSCVATSTAPACDPATGCLKVPPPDPPVCTDSPISSCAYHWAVPCNADGDCGTGFWCDPKEIGMCSIAPGGSAGALIPPSDTVTATNTVTCTVTNSFPGVCMPTATSCTGDADCPSVWTCTPAPSPPVVSTPPATAIDIATATTTSITTAPAPVPLPPSTTSTDTSTAPITHTCQPPASVSGILTSTGTTTVTYATPTQTVPGTSSNGSVTTAPVPTVPGDKATATSPTAANTGGGGCNISAGKDAAAAAWLLFLVGGLGLICARRRRY